MAKTIVLIDDDQDDLDFLKEAILKVDSNAYCISFNYPEEAIRVICEELIVIPTYLFVDINMPTMSGAQCVIELRKLKIFNTSVITVLSTSISRDVSKALKDLGANFAYEKPSTMDGYSDILANVFAR
jgi:DNA-binding NtrC family response regulator